MPNYQEMMKKQQESYERSRNPFEYGQQVARRRYSEIMSGLDNQRRAASRSYGDMYQAARQRAIGQQAMGGPTLSGGMGQQRRDYISALEMQELGRIGRDRLQSEADLYTQSQAAFSNAQLEGQQAAQTELANRNQSLQLVQTRQAIMNDKNLTAQQKQEQLEALEGGFSEGDTTIAPRSFGDKFGENIINIGGGAALTTALYKTGASAITAGKAIATAKAAAVAGKTAFGFAAAKTAAATAVNATAVAAGAAKAGVIAKTGALIAAGVSSVPVAGWVAAGVILVGAGLLALFSK